MKKLFFLSFMFSTFIFGFLTVSSAQEQKITAAVKDLEAKEGVSASVAASLSDYLRVQLINTQKFDIVTRENMEDLLKEQSLQLSGCTSNECIVQMGQLLGVRKMFAGVVTKIGNTYVVTLKIIDVESGKIEKAETEECAECKEEALLVSMRNIANKIAGLSVQPGAVPQAVQPAQIKIEEITWQKDNSVMVLIPAGEFLMGSPEIIEGYEDEYPRHKVFLDAYYIDKYEVTNEQFAKFLNEWGKDTDENKKKMFNEHGWGIKKVGSRFDIGTKGYENYPVVNVTWYGANQYAKWAGKRLPTEAEWEKACRAGSNTKYCYGDEENKLNEYAWYPANSGSKTHPVGEKKPNQWGLYDMHGNVWEWCSDCYDGGYYKSSPYKNPQGSDKGNLRVMRGGSGAGVSWGILIGRFCRSARRLGAPLAGGGDGFRCAASPK